MRNRAIAANPNPDIECEMHIQWLIFWPKGECKLRIFTSRNGYDILSTFGFNRFTWSPVTERLRCELPNGAQMFLEPEEFTVREEACPEANLCTEF